MLLVNWRSCLYVLEISNLLMLKMSCFRDRLPIPDNRRKIIEKVLPPLVYKRAEDMDGYQKFTLNEAIISERVLKNL